MTDQSEADVMVLSIRVVKTDHRLECWLGHIILGETPLPVLVSFLHRGTTIQLPATWDACLEGTAQITATEWFGCCVCCVTEINKK